MSTKPNPAGQLVQVATLRRLVKKWRKEARDIGSEEVWRARLRVAIEGCADELERKLPKEKKP